MPGIVGSITSSRSYQAPARHQSNVFLDTDRRHETYRPSNTVGSTVGTSEYLGKPTGQTGNERASTASLFRILPEDRPFAFIGEEQHLVALLGREDFVVSAVESENLR